MPLPLWKQVALQAYVMGSSPCRAALRRLAERSGKAPIMILFYHRVADHEPNQWTMDCETFAWQMGWLRDNFELVSLEEAQHRIRAGINRRPCVSVTFDDGYADNCNFALPLLRDLRIPCTYFVTTENVLLGKPFQHDVQRGIPLAPNSLEQLREFSAHGVEIGAHTKTHADLGCVQGARRMREEVVDAGRELGLALSRRVRYFAFPFGRHHNLNPAAFWLARDAGYDAVCSAYGGYNFPGDDPFHLQRIHADPECVRLRNWLTLDPRKWAGVERYQYDSPGQSPSPLGAAAP